MTTWSFLFIIFIFQLTFWIGGVLPMGDSLNHISREKELMVAYKLGNKMESQISVGMTKEEILKLWGQPYNIEVSPREVDTGGIKDVDEGWVYIIREKRKPRDRDEFYWLCFKKNILIKIFEVSTTPK